MSLVRVLPFAFLAVASTPNERVLRVCADPDAPAFEGKVAELLARDRDARLEYTWWPQRRGFFRNTLEAGRCDVVIALPKGIDHARTTRPWYRSTFVFVTRGGLDDLRSIDDPRLRTLRIGVPLAGDDGANPPPIHALARRGIIDNIRGFPLYAELGRSVPAATEALENGVIDVAISWGPAVRRRPGLVVTPLAESSDGVQPFAFSIAMGTRRSDDALARELDDFIVRRRLDLSEIVEQAGVPNAP